MRREQRRGLATAHPVRNHHRLRVHVLQTVLLHLRDDPVDRALETRRADRTIAVRVHQLGEPVPRGAVLQRAIDELSAGAACARRVATGSGEREGDDAESAALRLEIACMFDLRERWIVVRDIENYARCALV